MKGTRVLLIIILLLVIIVIFMQFAMAAQMKKAGEQLGNTISNLPPWLTNILS